MNTKLTLSPYTVDIPKSLQYVSNIYLNSFYFWPLDEYEPNVHSPCSSVLLIEKILINTYIALPLELVRQTC